MKRNYISLVYVCIFVCSSFFLSAQSITYGSGYSGPTCGDDDGSGAYYTGEYRNLFVEILGKSEKQVQSKIDKAWDHFFTPGKSTAVYCEVGDDMAYIHDVGNNDVRTEGQSYGMMICVQLDHQTEFDKIWRWTKKYMQHSGNEWDGYFAWQCKTDGTKIDPGCAPDGEEYFITALLLASNRWGNDGDIDYNAEAQNILEKIMNKTGVKGVHNMYDAENHMVVFSPLYENVKFSDPSYCLPGFMELWARWAETNNEFWAEAATAARTLLQKSCNEKTGLFPDYSKFDGTPYRPSWQSYDTKQFKFDAARCALNVGMDYNWFRSDSANQVAMMTRLLTFMDEDGFLHGYFDWDGGNPDGPYNEALAGANGVGCFAMNDTVLAKKVLSRMWLTPLPTGQWRYFNGMVYFLSLLNVSGNFRIYKPIEEMIDTTVNNTFNGITYDKSVTFSTNIGCKIYRVHVIVDNPNSVEPVNDYGLKLFPNPTNENVTVESQKEISSLELIDSEGKVLTSLVGTNDLCVAGLPKGLYFVKVHFIDKKQSTLTLTVN